MTEKFSAKKLLSQTDNETINYIIKNKLSDIGLFTAEAVIITVAAAMEMEKDGKKLIDEMKGPVDYIREATHTSIIENKEQLLSYMNDLDMFFELLPDNFNKEALKHSIYYRVEEMIQKIISEAKQEIFEKKKESGEIPIRLGYKK